MKGSRLINVVTKRSTVVSTTPLSTLSSHLSSTPQPCRCTYPLDETTHPNILKYHPNRLAVRYYYHQTHHHLNDEGEEASSTTSMVRLSKRMAHLDLCSRREADRLISQGLVLVNGKKIEPVLGQKVSSKETDISILAPNNHNNRNGGSTTHSVSAPGADNVPEHTHDGGGLVIDPWDWERIRADTIVLNKPTGYVSGQPDRRHGHDPAVRLLTRSNLYLGKDDDDDSDEGTERHREARETLQNGNYFHFGRLFMDDNRRDFSSTPPRVSSSSLGSMQNTLGSKKRKNRRNESVSTLLHYAPAGRLDLDSSGLLIFTKNGVVAKRLLSHSPPSSPSPSSSSSAAAATTQNDSTIHREYIVRVEPVESLSRIERARGMVQLPSPPRRNLAPLTWPIGSRRGFQGHRLWDDDRPLKPLVTAEWVDDEDGTHGRYRRRHLPPPPEHWDGKGTLRLVLQEGRKRQIRRMCRELLGLHVVDLVRVRIGSVEMEDLPEGMWRPLRRKEVEDLLGIDVRVGGG